MVCMTDNKLIIHETLRLNSYTPSLLREIQLTEDGTQGRRYVLAVGGKQPHRKKRLPKVYSYAVAFSVF